MHRLSAVTTRSSNLAAIGTVTSRSSSELVLRVPSPATLGGTSSVVISEANPDNLTGRVKVRLAPGTVLHGSDAPGQAVMVLAHRSRSSLTAAAIEPQPALDDLHPGTATESSRGAAAGARAAFRPTGDPPPGDPDSSPNTVNMVESAGLPGWSVSDSATLDLPFGCSADVGLQGVLGAGVKTDAPFQITAYPGALAVDSLDQPNGLGQWGPITLSGSQAALYTQLVNFGAAIGVQGQVSCGGVSYQLDGAGDGFAYQNETSQHMPLAGEPALEVPATSCPNVSIGVLDFSACLKLVIDPAAFTLNLVDPGGKVDHLTIGPSQEVPLPSSSNPNDLRATLDDFDYEPNIHTEMTYGFAGPSQAGDVEHADGKPTIKDTQLPDDDQPDQHRHVNQIGPTLENGEWMKTGHVWMTPEGKPLPADAPRPTDAEIQWGYAHWIHPNQDGPTLSDGRWKDGNGTWRGPKDATVIGGTSGNAGSFASPPSPEEITEATQSGETGGDDDGSADPDPEGDSPESKLIISLPVHWITNSSTFNSGSNTQEISPSSLPVTVPYIPPTPSPTPTVPTATTPSTPSSASSGPAVTVTSTDGYHYRIAAGSPKLTTQINDSAATTSTAPNNQYFISIPLTVTNEQSDRSTPDLKGELWLTAAVPQADRSAFGISLNEGCVLDSGFPANLCVLASSNQNSYGGLYLADPGGNDVWSGGISLPPGGSEQFTAYVSPGAPAGATAGYASNVPLSDLKLYDQGASTTEIPLG